MTFGEKWGIGSKSEENRKVFDTYLSKGGNFFDTANVYQNGDSEKFLGEYIQGQRSRCVLATKYSGHPNFPLHLAGVKSPFIDPNAGGNGRKSLVETLDGSLKRMGVGCTDLFYVHFWDYTTPIEEVVRSLDDVVRSGKAYYVAVSDTPAWVISRAVTMAEFRGFSRFIGLQTRYNLLDRSLESELLPMALDLDIGIVPWGVIAEGFLSGKYERGAKIEASGRSNRVTEHAALDRNWQILDTVKSISKDIGRSPVQVALNWTLQKQGITSPLIGARTVDQLNDNLACLDFTLTPEQVQLLDQVSDWTPKPFPSSFTSKAKPYFTGGSKIQHPLKTRSLFQ